MEIGGTLADNCDVWLRAVACAALNALHSNDEQFNDVLRSKDAVQAVNVSGTMVPRVENVRELQKRKKKQGKPKLSERDVQASYRDQKRPKFATIPCQKRFDNGLVWL